MISPQPTPPVPRRGMRKGTRSCYECRRRKVRCIFAKDCTSCESCAAKGRVCTEQKRELVQAAGLDTREGLRARVARLEATIQTLRNGSEASEQTSSHLEVAPREIQHYRIAAESSSSSSIAGNPTPVSISSPDISVLNDKDSSQNIDPIVTLFDNAIVSSPTHSNLARTKTAHSGNDVAPSWPRRASPKAPRREIQ
jgi:hypothetical protein